MTRTLEDALKFYRTLTFCRDELMDLVKREPRHFSDRWRAATDMAGYKAKEDPGSVVEAFFTEQVTPSLFEVCFLDVVSTFESIVYAWIDNASGEFNNILSDAKFVKAAAKQDNFPFRSYAAGFIKKRWVDARNPGDLRNLGDVKEILKGGGLDDALLARLEVIVNYRNWYAHGKRFAQPKGDLGKIEDVVEVLDEILMKIKP